MRNTAVNNTPLDYEIKTGHIELEKLRNDSMTCQPVDNPHQSIFGESEDKVFTQTAKDPATFDFDST